MSYTIDQFSKITGISKLVLRTWENRYQYLSADRTNTNIRSYSDKLLVKALKTKYLIDSGYKISTITKKNDNEINNIIEDLRIHSADYQSTDYYINKLIESGIDYNSKLFNKTYDQCMKDFDLIAFYTSILLPTLSKIGLFWLTNRINPGQEHFLSEMFKQKIYSEIDKISNQNHNSNTWLLFLPPDEYHEIGLLFSRLLLLKNSYDVVYLGANVPLSALSQVAISKEINNVLFFSISNFSKIKIKKTINFLDSEFKNSSIYAVHSSDSKDLFKKSKINLISSIQQFVQLISN